MSTDNKATTEALTAADQRRDFLSYVYGIIAALVLTVIPFGLVQSHSMSRTDIMVIIGVFAIVQALIHFRFFLHIGWNQKREDLLLLLFSGSLLACLFIGTLWVIGNLATRMMEMLPGMNL